MLVPLSSGCSCRPYKNFKRWQKHAHSRRQTTFEQYFFILDSNIKAMQGVAFAEPLRSAHRWMHCLTIVCIGRVISIWKVIFSFSKSFVRKGSKYPRDGDFRSTHLCDLLWFVVFKFTLFFWAPLLLRIPKFLVTHRIANKSKSHAKF